MQIAMDFTLLPDPIDVASVGSGSAIGSRAMAAVVWLIGCGIEFLT